MQTEMRYARGVKMKATREHSDKGCSQSNLINRITVSSPYLGMEKYITKLNKKKPQTCGTSNTAVKGSSRCESSLERIGSAWLGEHSRHSASQNDLVGKGSQS